MAATHNHGQLATHDHIMLVGFVVSFIYGLCHELWLNNITSKLATSQFYIHQVGIAVLVAGLFLLYGKFVTLETIDPVLALASITVFVGVILMNVLFYQTSKN